MSGFPRLGYPAGLIGATAATRYVGATVAGAPVAGTFQLGDFIIDQTGAMYFCTAAGSPGTWAPMAGIVGAFVETNGSYAATTTPVLRTRVAGDPNPRYELTADGKEQWGDGTAALDSNLYRASAGTLKTDGNLDATGYIASHNVMVAQYTTATETRIGNVGPGTTSGVLFGLAGDTNLYRLAAAQLRTDGLLCSGGDFYAQQGLASQVGAGALGPSGEASLRFGLVGDTDLYRSAAGTLTTDGNFVTGGGYLAVNNNNAYIQNGGASQVSAGALGPASQAGLLFGNAADTNLYRAGAATLRSDGNLQLNGYLAVGIASTGWALNNGNAAGGGTTGGVLTYGTGAPNNAFGANGDIYLRVDGGALTTIYQRRAGAWVGIV